MEVSVYRDGVPERCVSVSGWDADTLMVRRHNESLLSSPLLFLREAFLPAGYPASVSDDYARYQIWDSLQALCSAITGQLAGSLMSLTSFASRDFLTPSLLCLALSLSLLLVLSTLQCAHLMLSDCGQGGRCYRALGWGMWRRRRQRPFCSGFTGMEQGEWVTSGSRGDKGPNSTRTARRGVSWPTYSMTRLSLWSISRRWWGHRCSLVWHVWPVS